MPTYDDDDKAALAALLTRYKRFYDKRAADQALKAEVEARLATYGDQIKQLAAAFELFGVMGLKTENWEQLRKDLGEEIYLGALAKAKAPAQKSFLPPMSPEGALAEIEPENSASEEAGGTVREMVLDRLQNAGEFGAKAAALRASIEAARGAPLHEKTVGMTLYRLANDGLVRRDGRTWFYVPQDAETKNPGAVTPGPNNLDD